MGFDVGGGTDVGNIYAFNQLKEAPIFKMTNDKDADLHMRYFCAKFNDIVRWQEYWKVKFIMKKIRKKTNIPKEKLTMT